jgi:hypothetical protein
MASLEDSLLVIIGLAAYAGAFTAAVVFQRWNREKQRSRFKQAMRNGLRKNLLNSLEDVYNVYRATVIGTPSDSQQRVGLSRRLRELLTELLADDQTEIVVLSEWKQRLATWIDQIERRSPFEEVPAAERALLEDIGIFIEANDKAAAKRKVSELSASIRSRADEMRRVERLNKGATTLSVVGLVLTVVFGFLALTP